MAFASVGTGSTGASGTANQPSLSHVLATNPIAAGNLGLLAVAQWNATTIDGDQGVVSTVTDAAGNTWLKAREYQEGATATQLGAVASMWYTIADNTLSTGQNITITFLAGSSAAFDASCSNVWVFSHDAANSYIRSTPVNSTGTSVLSSTVPGTIDAVASQTGNYLRYRITASQTTSTVSPTNTAGWTSTETHRATAAKALSMRGEWIISTASSSASAMTINVATAHASVIALFEEVVRDVPMGQVVL